MDEPCNDHDSGTNPGCSVLWTAKCGKDVPSVPGKTIATWQSIEEEDDIFQDPPPVSNSNVHLTTIQPRFIDYKNDKFDMEADDDIFLNNVTNETETDEPGGDHDSNLPETNNSHLNESMENLRIQHRNIINNNDKDGNSNTDINMVKNNAQVYEWEKEIVPHKHLDKPLESVEVNRRQVVSIKPQIRRKSCPEPASEKSLSLPKNQAVDNLDIAEALRLKDVTVEARSMSRPLTKSKTIDISDIPAEHKTFNFISAAKPRIDPKPVSPDGEDEEEQPKTDFEILSHITAITRKATRPKLKDLELKPKSNLTRSKSVTQVTSPTVPALSPVGERHSRTMSFSSSGSSSTSEFPFYYQEPDPCLRCGKTVYQLDKVGPIRKALFHKQCFRCFKCNSTLTVQNYFQNFSDKSDQQVYCRVHQPSQGKAHVSIDDKNISVILDYPKLNTVNNTIRGPNEERHKYVNSDTLMLRGAMATPKLDMVFKQWNTVNKSFLDAISHSPAGGREGDLIRVSDTEPRSVWSRSAMGAASLDLSKPNPRRNIHHFYSYHSGHMNNL